MEYEISTIQQISDLSPLQQKDFLIDLSAWLDINNLAKSMMGSGFPVRPTTDKITWKDDGRPGVIDSIEVKFE